MTGRIDLPYAYDPAKAYADIRLELAERRLIHFIRQAWRVVEPGTPYVDNWHISMICAHLEAITAGDEIDGEAYNRLLVNIPPGMMKSLLVSVFWPAWIWGPRNKPATRFLCCSYSQSLAIRDNVRMRRLVSSDWYQQRWGKRVKLTGDQNSKLKFENSATGFREAVAAGSITGSRGDIVIIDDPHSVESASSDRMRATTIEWFLEAVPTRLNHPRVSAIVVIMQRLHEEDVSGVILEHKGVGLGYDHVMLPMRYDARRPCTTRLGHSDPRTVEGELLFPERFPESVVDRDERQLGPYATAGQMQQSPAPRGGGLIKDDWWTLWPDDEYPPLDYVLGYLDTAYGEKQEGDYCAMTVWGVFTVQNKAQIDGAMTRDGTLQKIERRYAEGAANVILLYAWNKRLTFPELLELSIKTGRKWKLDRLMIENKTAGPSLAQELRTSLSTEEFGLTLDNITGDKWARLSAVQHLFSEGMVWAPDKGWAEEVIRQVGSFPKAKHDDLVDTVSGALGWLRRTGLLTRAPERLHQIEESKVYRSRAPMPLYPG